MSCAESRVGDRPAAPPAATASPALAWDDPKRWRRLDSRHFTLLTDHPAREAERTLRDLEEYFAALVSVCFRGAVAGPEKIPVVALAEREETLRYLVSWAGGVFFSRHPYQPFIVLGVGKEGFSDSIVRHELVHYVMSLALRENLPLWFAEGVATYFETVAYDRGRARLLLGRAELSRVMLLSKRGPHVPVTDLMTDRAQALLKADPERFYVTCWLLVHLLVHKSPDVFAAYERALLEGRDAGGAWQLAAPADLRNTLDARLAGYLRDKGYQAGRRLAWVAPPVTFVATPVAPADMLAMTALLHLVGSRQQPEREAFHRKAARTRAADALALDPTNLVALQVGLVLGDPPGVDQARAAIRQREHNWIAWMLLFDALLRDGKTEEGRAALARAATLAPTEPAVREAQKREAQETARRETARNQETAPPRRTGTRR